MKSSLLLCLTFFIPAAAYAGPFGLEMGMPLSELSKIITLKDDGNYSYSTSSLPRSHPDFNLYTLRITPTHGLCSIVAMGRVINTSVYGTELINAFDNIESSLTSKYGTPKHLDYLLPGSIWHEPNDWMMSLLKKERVLTSYWKDDSKKLPDNLRGVEIDTHGIIPGKAILSLKYEFTNKAECSNWIKSQVNSSL